MRSRTSGGPRESGPTHLSPTALASTGATFVSGHLLDTIEAEGSFGGFKGERPSRTGRPVRDIRQYIQLTSIIDNHISA